jgi:hypothetical protein
VLILTHVHTLSQSVSDVLSFLCVSTCIQTLAYTYTHIDSESVTFLAFFFLAISNVKRLFSLILPIRVFLVICPYMRQYRSFKYSHLSLIALEDCFLQSELMTAELFEDSDELVQLDSSTMENNVFMFPGCKFGKCVF